MEQFEQIQYISYGVIRNGYFVAKIPKNLSKDGSKFIVLSLGLKALKVEKIYPVNYMFGNIYEDETT